MVLAIGGELQKLLWVSGGEYHLLDMSYGWGRAAYFYEKMSPTLVTTAIVFSFSAIFKCHYFVVSAAKYIFDVLG